MLLINDIRAFDSEIAEDESWNQPRRKELLMHRIHAYPAKFPAFLTPKIIEYLVEKERQVERVADIFCGCGTSALETKILGIDYVGFDINPVATLISKTKSETYNVDKLMSYFEKIFFFQENEKILTPNNIYFHERINYWFPKKSITDLYRILKSIQSVCPNGKYKRFFLTAFSNILKPCSRWLTKSIKPQIDPQKNIGIPKEAFKKQVELMIKANLQLANFVSFQSRTDIHTKNILNTRTHQPFADLIITSPPYVTSYEYADLHQLSTLWLGFAQDYRELRAGTIGSEYYSILPRCNKLNETGKEICKALSDVDKAKTRAVAKYFIDIDKMVAKTREILINRGSVAFVIGDTSYKGVEIKNSKFLANSLIDNGYKNLRVVKRKISSKILTPYRDESGKFSNNGDGRKVYSHEYLLLADM